MTTWLFLLAFVAQSADAAVTCNRLQRGWREVNPIFGQSCARVATIKAAALGAVALPLPTRVRRLWLVGLTVGGGVGVTVALTVGKP